ncbi:HpaII family restriction endonuclease [Bathymodiolus thermophilus thioautotrophic gill symbiont]|uniref:Uncharacterized protein n=1 Tax=Bathymodiolus thermophilus thioautotrophic gill symbiont TaxID=2360 RepID=A0A1J5TUV3_9GAMM|nr:hypothetical protein BGC33_14230 [Bathymodiolus thermophilus thioautotrophic gill symbiont]
MNNHQKSTFHPLGNFLNLALALLGQGLRKSPSGQKLNFANHPYLCKGLYLYENTKFESASSSRHNYGKIYQQEGEMYFNLNLQIRFIK